MALLRLAHVSSVRLITPVRGLPRRRQELRGVLRPLQLGDMSARERLVKRLGADALLVRRAPGLQPSGACVTAVESRSSPEPAS